MQLLHFKGRPIGDHLAHEEELLRNVAGNFCLINEGSPPAIVMGISGKQEELVCPETLNRNPIPVLRRFSGGGTVIVDEDTLFVTFIFDKHHHPFSPYPEPILRWAETFYQEAFSLPSFRLRENDFTLGERKCGGNALYIRKQNWLLHTSFLWDFTPEKMNYLLFPKKTPHYRQGRAHHEFVCSLKEHFPDKTTCVETIKKTAERVLPSSQQRPLS